MFKENNSHTNIVKVCKKYRNTHRSEVGMDPLKEQKKVSNN